ncbi:hypothetical protein PC9H_001857 [Pleurotus ostreatus]|uniref:Protein kinase domain-containing protein n=1 Tax=Pleurotus ostreatus TaxID=5322 RepID=A0A8H7DM30_PLEOS|nr:uncharacterized protein PC9H_001857 [Pleurotus ostreatus]KAF7419270.1 hypothetical protein PC9H_001857 [Pleurotus ostreatus]
MAFAWRSRKHRLDFLLQSQGDDDQDGIVLDRLLHGQSIIGKTARTAEIDSIRFQDKDLNVVGTLDRGQFGVIDVVKCVLDDRVYIRKSTEKQLALRARGQCSPQYERDILLRARQSQSEWVPHLLCAFQTPTHLNLLMDYAEGGSLWDVLESHPEGRIPEDDMSWWVPQIVSAIGWCHEQGYAHRDIKPHNFVLTNSARVLLIDFGSAAPLLPPRPDGSRALPKRACMAPCGTCDYISPEILRFHEDALVALEMDGEDIINKSLDEEGYGLETDWWSLGAMLYELVYGVAPFFAEDIRQTYARILAHDTCLRFDKNIKINEPLRDLLSRLLTDADHRMGRRGVGEILNHPYFEDVPLDSLTTRPLPDTLHIPRFIYAEGSAADPEPSGDESRSQGFAFSIFFQSSSPMSERPEAANETTSSLSRSTSSNGSSSSFIGFSWGPTIDAFPDTPPTPTEPPIPPIHPGLVTPRPTLSALDTGRAGLSARQPQSSASRLLTPGIPSIPYTTPVRLNGILPYATLPRGSTIRRSATVRRAVSDREAMKQLVDCIGMSARKKVLESGKKPRILPPFKSLNHSGTLKELRFFPAPIVVPAYGDTSSPMYRRQAVAVLGSDDGTATEIESEGPPSPSPSPRPGSAMSFMSKRSGTPTITTTFSQRMSGSSFLSIPRPSSGRPRSTSTGSLPAPYNEPYNEPSLSLDEDNLADVAARYASLMADLEAIEEKLRYVAVMST